MIKKFFKKPNWAKCKAFFSDLVKRFRTKKWKKPDFSALKKIKLPKWKKPNFSRIKKTPIPAPLKKAGKAIRKFFSKKTLSRLSVALCAVALGGILILWDTGVINLPFLTRRGRRESPKESQASSTTTTVKNQTENELPGASPAADTIRSLYAFAGVNLAKTPVTDLPYRSDSMTITKQILPAGNYTTAMGFVVKNENGKEMLFTAPDAQEILDSEGYRLTHYRTLAGDAVFTKDGTEGYFCYDGTSRTFFPIAFDPNFYAHASIGFALPRSYGQSDEGKELVFENGLYGYKGTYADGNRTKKFTVPAVYPTAYNYSEGFAVMADAEGRVTIRNERGEEVFTEYALILPEKKDEEALGFTYFDGGLLRVIVASYDDTGSLTSRRETMINTLGQEVSVPAGYTVVSLHEGILLVTDGEFYGYLSSKGAWLSPPVYTAASPFFEGLAVVTNKDGKTGLIDSQGKSVLPCAFDRITSFSDGNALCYSEETGWYLLTKVAGIYYHDPALEETPNYTKITITRGPQNTFDYEPDEIIELLPPTSTVSRTTRPENTVSQEVK
ncbi:MAG: WG repeat-containing protein [Ruminococcaceae bacterium]|nr:WG repeat-containing protein [Oscillospiraceae bacterium]